MLEDIRSERLKKRQQLETAGLDAYPAKVKRTETLSKILAKWDFYAGKSSVSIAGRVYAKRGQGALMFLDVKDEQGALQVVLREDNVSSKEEFALLRDTLDIGDFVEATGPLIVTKRGEKSVDAKSARIITKSLLPIPSEHFGIENEEVRLRKRYLDLLINPELREMFRKKTIFWSTFRTELIKAGFLEVETPVLELTPGGADAEPFKTHHNALDIDMTLRISLELPLKRLMVGGFDKVFEIGRIFRNEGIDAEHLQDYTQLEFYWGYADYKDLMKFIEKTYKKVIEKTTGSLKMTRNGQEIDWSGKWPSVDYFTIFKEKTGLDLNKVTEAQLLEYAKSHGIDIAKHDGKGRLIDVIFKSIRKTLIQPCFLINPPVEVEPLAKRLKMGSNKVARFQVVAGGTELGKGFSELNDPIDQRERFEEQMRLRDAGDKEAQVMDEDFVEALEYGMPPTAGFGISERLFAILMDKPIRETVFFPTMKPKGRN
jgi:lysyl-tRNA synthetase class 2